MKNSQKLFGLIALAASLPAHAAETIKIDFNCLEQIRAIVAFSSGVNPDGWASDPAGYDSFVKAIQLKNLTVTDVFVDAGGFTEGTQNVDVVAKDGYDRPVTGKVSMRATRGGCMVKSMVLKGSN